MEWSAPAAEVEPERDGLDAADERWAVPWLKGLRRVPPDAVWPRLMTVPHPAAVDSLGPELVRFAEARSGGRLRWWQQLVATRLLEVDAAGELVWETVIWSMARQLGKSWLLRELILWRIHQGDRFGEAQDVMHTGKDVAICREIQRSARAWAKTQDGYKVREVNGNESIEVLADGSRWLIKSKGAPHGYSISVAAVDEAWKVHSAPVEEDLTPTMVEKAQAQLWLISTAHRLATGLMLERRKVALAGLETGDGDLLIEWSAPHDAALDDRAGWRQASPHWTPRRERMIQKRYEAALAGEIDPDAEEPDPEELFRAQWLNQWPRRRTEVQTGHEDLLPAGLWASLAEPGLASHDALFVAMEDNFGKGAAVAAVSRLDDGRLEVDGWRFDTWAQAVDHTEWLQSFRDIRELHVGASMIDSIPRDWSLPRAQPVGTAQAKAGLAVFRDLAATGMLAHDDTQDLDNGLQQAQVKETSTGLVVVRGPAHLVKATVWAVAAAHKPAPIYAVA